jgi:hypothetical protein
MLLAMLVIAAAATVGLILVISQSRPTVVPPLVATQIGAVPRLVATVPVIVAAAIFVVSWIGVVVAYCRDQILHRVEAIERTVGATLTTLDAVRAEITSLRGGLAEYGEQRETDGYVHGVRAAAQRTATTSRSTGDVRPLHRVPPLE